MLRVSIATPKGLTMRAATDRTDRAANREYGYPFGVDGIMSVEQAMAFLACSKSTIYRLIEAGKLRHGRMGPAARICRRSITDYLDGIES